MNELVDIVTKKTMKKVTKCNKSILKLLLKLNKKLKLKKYEAFVSHEITDSGKVVLHYQIDIPVGKIKLK